MWTKETSKLFLLGCLYGFEKDNEVQPLEFNCPKINYMLDMTVLLRSVGIPFHLEKKGVRLLIVSDSIKTYDSFLRKEFNLDYTYPLKIKWPDFLETGIEDPSPFIDGIFETAGIFTSMQDRFPFVLHIQNEKTTQKISEILDKNNIENIWVKNPTIKSLCTLQVVDGEGLIKKFLKTNPSSKYSGLRN